MAIGYMIHWGYYWPHKVRHVGVRSINSTKPREDTDNGHTYYTHTTDRLFYWEYTYIVKYSTYFICLYNEYIAYNICMNDYNVMI